MEVIGEHLEPDRAVLACPVIDPDGWCRRCGCQGVPRDSVIIDLTGIRDGTGPGRLLDMVQGRSKQTFKTWLAARPKPWRNAVEVAAMDGFHVVRLDGEALDQCRRRVQQDTRGHHGPTGDPLYSARRTQHTGADLLTDKQQTNLAELFAADPHVQGEASRRIHQQMTAAYACASG